MKATLTIYDETMMGEKRGGRVLDFLTETVTVRELIRERVYEEVREYNAARGEYFNGLVQPTDTEKTLNGYKMRERKTLDWEKQYKKAVEAFERNGFFVLVDDKQAESLDESITIGPTTAVSFVQLVPLVGG